MMQDITLQLPETVLQRVRQAADSLHQPLDQVLAALISAALPDVTDAPAELQPELARMVWLGDAELWAIAQSQMTDEQQTQLRNLGDRQAQRLLTTEEQETLASLRQIYGQFTLRKARAYALLSLRGGRPLLASN